jgi:DNA invertase Pin-like site-specific DNA recombinase
MDWAQVRALAADGVSQTQIAARLGINRRTVKRLFGSGRAAALSPGAIGVDARRSSSR